MRVHRVDRKKESTVYFKWAAAIIILGAFYVWQRIKAEKLGYKISETNDKILTLSEENKRLTMKMMSITALDNLEDIAKKMGLVAPKSSDIVIIEEKK